jgi:hypothetical protein
MQVQSKKHLHMVHSTPQFTQTRLVFLFVSGYVEPQVTYRGGIPDRQPLRAGAEQYGAALACAHHMRI